ncbi:putative ribosome quality control (RQC) complex YloA/Tae2 family protein [Deinococcus sp. HSC-46F16]|uniref:Rqc2 family fibronectin-binding protein n=1 Tax=Deinococcus sp. HSC-46F16 TaxID=2910968 RepID=UPI0020A159B7|nr:NFACT family protein [Deinococcus sp. HSC-46F16]MCP2013286.1 putative ribosome quality control (RQC) complex YloA/Tae2 family protein [Deinococcus sp. HSC-46F16]
MEGLMLARVLRELLPHLPARTLGWAFPDETTAALLLDGVGNLVLSYRPPQPVVFLSRERLRGEPHNGFQRYLAARVRGDLTAAEQLKLDRVFTLHFAGEDGFVPQPPTRLLFEVTGRNANVLVLEPGEGFSGRILMAAREITGSRNRFRTVRSGGEYTPPPPYDKLDPRTLTPEEARSLADLPVGRWRERLDGLGPLLGAELGRRVGLAPVEAPGDRWPQVLTAVRSLVADPSVSEGVMQEGAREAARAEKAAALRKALREPLDKRVTLLDNQLADVSRAEAGLDAAAQDRGEADLLMAYAHTVEPGAASVLLPAFDGSGEVPVALDPSLGAVQNAEKRYTRARRREEVYERLAEREPGLRAELEEARARLMHLDTASLEDLEALSATLQQERPEKSPYGMRFTTPGGFETLVGRNNKENATLTHRLGRSLDHWFHAQGYPGSHVLVRSGGRDLDLPDILYAARLAAAHSKARGSSNVPVDYTRIKHVWRPKGAPAGQVHYTDQKTVFVDGTLPE